MKPTEQMGSSRQKRVQKYNGGRRRSSKQRKEICVLTAVALLISAELKDLWLELYRKLQESSRARQKSRLGNASKRKAKEKI